MTVREVWESEHEVHTQATGRKIMEFTRRIQQQPCTQRKMAVAVAFTAAGFWTAAIARRLWIIEVEPANGEPPFRPNLYLNLDNSLKNENLILVKVSIVSFCF